MKTPLIVTLFFVIVNGYSQPNTWEQKANILGQSKSYSISFSIKGKGYIGTGWALPGPAATSDLWSYDPTLDTWSQKANYPPGNRYGAFSFVIGDSAYVGGGFDGSVIHNEFYAYEPIGNTWYARPNFAGGSVYNAAGCSINNVGYVAGGSTGGPPYLTSLWSYNPLSGTWTVRTPLPGTGRSSPNAIVSNGKMYLVCGLISNAPTATDEVWEYNPTSNSWLQKGNFDGGVRFAGNSFNIYDNGYYGCGANSSLVPFNDFWQYNPGTDTWTSLPAYTGSANRAGLGFAINGYGYFGSGMVTTSSYSNQFYRYIPLNQAVNDHGENTIQAYYFEGMIYLSDVFNGELEVVVFDMAGNKISQIKNSPKSLTIPLCRPETSGIYLYSIYCNNRILKSGKFSIVK